MVNLSNICTLHFSGFSLNFHFQEKFHFCFLMESILSPLFIEIPLVSKVTHWLHHTTCCFTKKYHRLLSLWCCSLVLKTTLMYSFHKGIHLSKYWKWFKLLLGDHLIRIKPCAVQGSQAGAVVLSLTSPPTIVLWAESIISVDLNLIYGSHAYYSFLPTQNWLSQCQSWISEHLNHTSLDEFLVPSIE